MGTSETTPAEREGEILDVAGAALGFCHQLLEDNARLLASNEELLNTARRAIEIADAANKPALESELSALSAPVSDAPWTPGVGEYAHAEVRVYDTDGVTAGVEFPYKGKTAAMRLDVSCLRPAAAAPGGGLSGNAGELPEYKLPESHNDDPEWDDEWYDTLINQVEQTSYTLGLTAANTDEWPTSIEKKVELYREQLRAYGRKCIAPSAAVDAEPVGYQGITKRGAHLGFWLSKIEAENELLSYNCTVRPIFTHPAPASAPKLAAGIDADRVIECAEGMSAFTHGSDGFDAYRRKLCRLLGKPEDHISSHRLVIGFPVAVAGQAVAPVSVVEEIRAAYERVTTVIDSYHRYGKASVTDLEAASAEFYAALAGITVLPEPSEWAKARANNIHFGDVHMMPFTDNAKTLTDMAAAFLQRATLRATAKEGK